MKHSFDVLPSVRYRRSQMPLPRRILTSFSVGQLIPLKPREVLAGDSFKVDSCAVARVASSFIKPVMDNLYLETYHFYVPYRLLYNKTERVFGNASPSAYEDNDLAKFPSFDDSGEDTITISQNSIGDYLGYPVGTISSKDVSVLPFRAYALVVDKWFRNENIIDEIYVQKGELNNELPNNNDFAPDNYMGKPFNVGRRKDYFTACLPAPQKGVPQGLQLQFANDTFAPVYPKDPNKDSNIHDPSSLPDYGDLALGSELPDTGPMPLGVNQVDSDRSWLYPGFYDVSGSFSGAEFYKVAPENLWAYLGDVNTGRFSINDLRFAFQMQKMLEKDARGGSRYNEYLLSHFGVSINDSRVQFPEYLGGSRTPISVQGVVQTSQTSEDSPLANVGAFSLTNGFSKYNKGFVEPGYVLTVMCIRQVHTYSQGLPKMFTRLRREDFYDPLFANLGEQPVYTSEIFASTSDHKGDILGYNEAWADYRYEQNLATGNMRPGATNTLDIWHFGDYYEEAPTLGKDFITESPGFVDRTLSVPSTSMPQFVVDYAERCRAFRVMPVYSIPGLIDHH